MSNPVLSTREVCEQVVAELQKYRASIDDIFYDYKSDDDLDFNVYFDVPGDAVEVSNVIEKMMFVEATCNESDHIMHGLGRIVTITVANLNLKKKLVDILRQEGWRPNGG